MKNYKTIILTSIMVFTLYSLKSQSTSQPEKILKITEVCHPHNYYKAQINLWKEVLKKDKKNADAWFNYYKANRYAQATSESDTIYSKERFEKIQSIVEEMKEYIPNSYEYNIIKWLNGGNNKKNYPYLIKAHELRPREIEPMIDLLTYHELDGNIEKRNYFAKLWYESGEVSPGLLNYNYNVLQSLKSNAVILTYGDNDTYPLWILQIVHNVRPDVKVLNFSLVHNYEYAKKINSSLEINIPACEFNPCSMLEILIENCTKTKRPFYLTLTQSLDPSIKDKYETKLYLTGMAYEYSPTKIDNIAILKKNVEKNFVLDYLKLNVAKDKSIEAVKEINTNYVVPFLTLYNHYKVCEDIDKTNYYKSLITRILKDAKREDMLTTIFDSEKK